MTRDDVTRMAREAGGFVSVSNFDDRWFMYADSLERFAALVAAAERAAIIPLIYGHCDSDNGAQRTVDAIRARGQG